MNYEGWSYKAIQAECKEQGLNAKGSRGELIERLQGDSTPTGNALMFVFVGGKDRTIKVTRYNKNGQPYLEDRVEKADNPPSITIKASNEPGSHEYTFALNGDPVRVEDVRGNRRLIERLRNGSHFVEIVADQEAAA